jgi:hypothetical protein
MGQCSSSEATSIEVLAEVMFEYTEECVVPNDVTIVRFHPSVIEVEFCAFNDCNILKKVILNDGLQKIGAQAFDNCTSLSSIKLPSTVTEIGSCAFSGCCNLREVVFHDGLQKIRRYSFYSCTSLSTITIPSTVTEIGDHAFSACSNLREVVLHEGLRKIEQYAFYNCKSLSSINLPSTVTEIGNGALNNTRNLMEVVFNEGLQKIGVSACYAIGNSSISIITLPSTVTEIGRYAFDDCNNLREVILHGVPQKIAKNAFFNCTSLERFTFPTISTRLYNLILTGHWGEIENEVDEVRGVVERSGGKLFVLVTQSMREGGNNWSAVRRDLDNIVRVISCYELKEGTSVFELALWKFKLDQVDKANPIPRKKCRMDVPGPAKDIILQYLPYECLLPVSDIPSSSSESDDEESSDGDYYESTDDDYDY